jgi:hypothetical protein
MPQKGDRKSRWEISNQGSTDRKQVGVHQDKMNMPTVAFHQAGKPCAIGL